MSCRNEIAPGLTAVQTHGGDGDGLSEKEVTLLESGNATERKLGLVVIRDRERGLGEGSVGTFELGGQKGDASARVRLGGLSQGQDKANMLVQSKVIDRNSVRVL